MWRGPAAPLPTAASPTDIAGHPALGARRRQSIVASWDGLKHGPKTGRATGPPWPAACPGHSGSSLGHDAASPPRSAPAPCPQSNTPHSWTHPNPGSPNAIATAPRVLPVAPSGSAGQGATCPEQPRQQAGSPQTLVLGRRMGTDTQREGLSLLSHRHPPYSGHGYRVPASPRGCREAPATHDVGQDGPPLWPPGLR